MGGIDASRMMSDGTWKLVMPLAESTIATCPSARANARTHAHMHTHAHARARARTHTHAHKHARAQAHGGCSGPLPEATIATCAPPPPFPPPWRVQHPPASTERIATARQPRGWRPGRPDLATGPRLGAGPGAHPWAGVVAVAEGLLDLAALRLGQRGDLVEDVAEAVVGVGADARQGGGVLLEGVLEEDAHGVAEDDGV